MQTDKTIRRNEIHGFIFSRKDSTDNKVTVHIIQEYLQQTRLHVVTDRTIRRDLEKLCGDYDALNRVKSSKPYQKPYQWWWDKNEEDIELPIPLDTTTAMTLLVTQKFIKDMLPPIQSLEHYFNQASDELNDRSINSWITNKIEVVSLPHDLKQPVSEDGDAFPKILNALFKDKCFKANYSRSAYDLNEYGKWEPKTIYAADHNDIIQGRIYHPLGMFRQGSVYFLVAYVTDLRMGIDITWRPNLFAMHKFSEIEEFDRDVDRRNFSLQEYIRTGRTYGAPDDLLRQNLIDIDLEIYVSPAVGEYLYESEPHNLKPVHCRNCAGTERRGNHRDDRRGWRCFKGNTEDSEQLRRWLLSLRDVEVLAPAELREYFKAKAEATLSYYPETTDTP